MKSSVPTPVPGAPRKKPQWLLDEEAADPTLAGKLDAARAEAAKVAAEKAARDAERAAAWLDDEGGSNARVDRGRVASRGPRALGQMASIDEP
jgi:hypothetical protein